MNHQPQKNPHRRRRIARHAGHLASAAIGLSALLGCTGPADTKGPEGPLACPSGHIAGANGECMPVGIQGCADIFLEEDGLCRPSIDKCPAGTIPKFTQGCVPVGIQGCAGIFIEEDGLCHPSIDKCPAGTIPKLDEGCVPVGIPSCAPEFVEADGICHPRMAKCPAGTFAVPQKGCLSIDGPAGCGSGTWGNIADGPDTVYVDPTYPNTDSDGSKTKPVKTIAAALGLVPTGGRVALGAGVYPEGVTITKTMTIEGRCPSMVRIDGTMTSAPATIRVNGPAGVTIRGVEVGGPGSGIIAEFSPGLVIDGVHVRNATTVGIAATGTGSTVSISNTLIEGTLPAPMTSQFGYGVEVFSGADVTLNDTAVIGSRRVGILAISPADLTAADVLVEGTLYGEGVAVQDEVQAHLSASAIVANTSVGLGVIGAGADVTAGGNLIEGTLPKQGSNTAGIGIVVQEQANATLTGNVILKNRLSGIHLAGAGDTTIAGNLIRDTLQEESSQKYGQGIGIISAAHTIANDNAIVGNHAHGFNVGAMALKVTASRNLVEGTLPTGPMNDDLGVGIQLCSPDAALTENAVVRNRMVGLAICSGIDTIASDNLIEGTLPWQRDESGGAGVVLMNGATAILTGNAILDNHAAGLSLADPALSVTASGNLIRHTLPQPSDQRYGNGIEIAYGARATLMDNVVLENHLVGIVAEGMGSQITASGNLVQRTLGQPDGNYGQGIIVSNGGWGWFSQNAVLDNRVAGFIVSAPGSELVAEGNLVEGTLAEALRNVSGLGIACQDSARCTITSSLVRDNLGAGILAFNGVTAEISASAVYRTMLGAFAGYTSMDVVYTDIGDGILADDSWVQVTDSVVQDCARAGILFNASSGGLSSVSAQNNRFGLVIQGGIQPSYEAVGNVFEPNQKQDIVIGGDLPIPNNALPVPDPPAPQPTP